MIRRAEAEHGCIMSYRKDRHSEKFMSIPYRISMRGETAEAAVIWLLDLLCSEHRDLISPECIWGLPVPEESHMELVQTVVGETTIRIAAQSSSRIDDRQEPLVIEQPAAQQAGLTAKENTRASPEKVADYLKALYVLAIQKWKVLHWQYQKTMEDHLGQPFH